MATKKKKDLQEVMAPQATALTPKLPATTPQLKSTSLLNDKEKAELQVSNLNFGSGGGITKKKTYEQMQQEKAAAQPVPTANLSEGAIRRIDEQMRKNPHRGEKFQIGNQIVSYEEYLKAIATMGKPQYDQTPEDTAYLASVGDVTSQKKIQQQQQQEALISRIGQEPATMPMQATPINWEQIALSTAADPSVIRGAVYGGGAVIAASMATGAAAGSAIPIVGTIAGAGVGLSLGIYSSIMSNIKKQKTQKITEQTTTLKQGSTYLNKLINLIQVDPENADLYIDGYNEQMARISEAYSQLKLDTESDLNLALSQDGTTALIKFENFYSPGGAKDYYDAKLVNALANPKPDQAAQSLLIDTSSLLSEIEGSE